jgi:hypothetical protein
MAHPTSLRFASLTKPGLVLFAALLLAAIAVVLAPHAFASGSGNYAFEYYAGGYQSYNGVGVSANMSQHVPVLSEPPGGTAWFDSTALIRAVSPDNNEVVEAGWLVSSTINGDGGANAHLFVRKIDHGTGCFNNMGPGSTCGFIPYSTTHTIGMVLTPTTTPQNFVIEHYYGNWWIGYQGDWVGYFPDSAWSTPFTTIGSVGWYGRVGSTNSTPCADMGNGLYGTQTGSAVFTNMSLITPNYSYIAAKATPYMTNAQWYNVGAFYGSSFQYGGPGDC